MEISTVVEKIGYILCDVAEVPEGISKKTGKPYPAFANIRILIHGQAEVSILPVDMAYVDEVKAATSVLEYLSPVKVSGIQNASGKFKVTAIEKWKVN